MGDNDGNNYVEQGGGGEESEKINRRIQARRRGNKSYGAEIDPEKGERSHERVGSKKRKNKELGGSRLETDDTETGGGHGPRLGT